MKSPQIGSHTYGQFILMKLSLSFDRERIVFEINGLVQLGMPSWEIVSPNHVICKHEIWTSWLLQCMSSHLQNASQRIYLTCLCLFMVSKPVVCSFARECLCYPRNYQVIQNGDESRANYFLWVTGACVACITWKSTSILGWYRHSDLEERTWQFSGTSMLCSCFAATQILKMFSEV